MEHRQRRVVRLSVAFREDIRAARVGRLVLFDGNAIRLGVRIMADAGHLPGDLHAWRAAGDAEAVILDLLGDIQAGRGRAESLLRSGAARAKLDEIVDAQGRLSAPARPGALTHAVHAPGAVHVGHIDVAQISEIARRAGAPLDKTAGIDLAVRIGERLRRGTALYTIHASAAVDLEEAALLAARDSGVR